MENKITPQQALQNIYVASRKAPLTADEHELIKQCAVILQDALSPKEEPKKK